MGQCAATEQGDYITIDSSDVYDGAKFLCFRHGEGTYQYSNGDSYKGQWKWNKKHGHGVYRHTSGEIQQGFFYEDDYIGEDPGDLFAATSCFSGCFGSNSAKPLESDKNEEIRHQEQREAKKEQLDQRAKDRKERKKRRDAIAEKYKIAPKNAGHIQDPRNPKQAA